MATTNGTHEEDGIVERTGRIQTAPIVIPPDPINWKAIGTLLAFVGLVAGAVWAVFDQLSTKATTESVNGVEYRVRGVEQEQAVAREVMRNVQTTQEKQDRKLDDILKELRDPKRRR